MKNSFIHFSPILPSPLPPHPRLLASEQDWLRIKNQLLSDSVSTRLFASLEKKARHLLSLPPLERTMTGRRLLDISRQALERISILAIVFRITEEACFASRAIDEMKAISSFKDWNPSHFLDTAEMALALALGYDWLNDQLQDREKDLFALALLEKGILPSLEKPTPWYLTSKNNWNQVCHAGLAAAAIAVADREPEISETVLRRSVDNIAHSAAAYAPDGAYPEGPGYWIYGTSFHVILAAALKHLTGGTLGVDAYSGFTKSADYILQVTTATGHFYDYADCRKVRPLLVPLFWFARHFDRPELLNNEIEKLDYYLDLFNTDGSQQGNYRLLALALLWRNPISSSDQVDTPEIHWMGRGTMPIAVHRSAWNNREALFAAIKGGSPSSGHAHMDSGSFMLEADGVAWATDLGMQDYESLEKTDVKLWSSSQEGGRWSVFRLGPEGHNILRFNNAPQLVQGKGVFTHFCNHGLHPHSVLDLTSLYSDQAVFVQRGLMLRENRAVLIQDEWIAGDQPLEVTWQMLTPASVSIESTRIQLKCNEKGYILQVLDSAKVFIESQNATELLKPFDAPNPGVQRVTIKSHTEAGQKGSLRVLGYSCSSVPILLPPPMDLDQWSDPLI